MNRMFVSIWVIVVGLIPAIGSGQEKSSVQAQNAASIKTASDVVYNPDDAEPLQLDLAWPGEGDGPWPCVVFIHGGAWRGGHRKSHLPQVNDFARRGYVAVTVSYRLCPKHIYPAQIEDVKCAIRFLRANREKYHVIPDRIGAVGFSAGAHLAMLLGAMGPDDGLEGGGGWADQPSQVQAVVAFFGPTDLGAEDLPEVSKPLVRDFLGGTPAEKSDLCAQASPLTYVSRGDAPLLIYQGTKDPLVPHSQAIKMIDRMTAAGVGGRIEFLIGAGHGWQGTDLTHTLDGTAAFLERHLKAR